METLCLNLVFVSWKIFVSAHRLGFSEGKILYGRAVGANFSVDFFSGRLVTEICKEINE